MVQHSRPASSKASRVDDALARADVALRMGNAVEAEQIASAVLKADKANVPAATIAGRALMALNRNDEAVALLERATRRSTDPSIGTLFAMSLDAAGRNEDAINQLKSVTSSKSVFPPAFRELIGRLAMLNRIDEAVEVARRGIAAAPDAVELKLDLASLFLRRNDRASARAVLSDARSAAPGRPDVLAELATVMLLDGDYAEAAETFRQSLALQPDNAMTRSNLAACQLELGQRQAGEASLRSATNGRPQMLGRAIHALAASSHGRFFMRPSRATKFLRGEQT